MIQQMLKFPLSAGTGRCFELHCPPDLSLVEIKKAQQVINLFFEMHEPEETHAEDPVSQQIHSEEKPDEEKQLGKPTQKTTVETKPDKPAQSQKLLKPRNGRPYVSKDSGRMSLGLKEAIKDWLKFVGKRQTELIRLINAKSAYDGKQIAWMLYGQVNTSSDVIAAIQAITGIEAVLEEQVDGKKLWVCSESTHEKFANEGEAEPDEGDDVHHGEGEPEENTADPSENFTGGGGGALLRRVMNLMAA